MADPAQSPKINKALSLNLEELQALGPDALAQLQKEHGLEIQIRSSAVGIDRLSKNLGQIDPTLAAYDRGFDRTSPGYDKYYDRDRSSMVNPADLVTQPGDPVVDPGPVITPAVDVQAIVTELLRRAGGGR